MDTESLENYKTQTLKREYTVEVVIESMGTTTSASPYIFETHSVDAESVGDALRQIAHQYEGVIGNNIFCRVYCKKIQARPLYQNGYFSTDEIEASRTIRRLERDSQYIMKVQQIEGG